MPYLRSAGHFSPHIRDAPAPAEGFHGPTGCQPSGRATTLCALARFHRGYPGTADFGAALALIWVSVSVGACTRGVAGRDSRKEARMAYRHGAWALAWLAAWAAGCSGATADDNA